MWVGACGRACSSARQENFIGFAFWWKHLERFWLYLGVAFAGFNAFTGIRSKEALFASASSFANTWAQWIGIFARSIATFALTIFFISFARLNRWEHHERFWLYLGDAFAGFNALIIFISEVTFLASASWFADTWAQWIWVFAGTIATFAFTEFFVITARLNWWEHHERFWLNLSRTFAGFNAFTSIGSEMSFLASAARNADTRAQGVGIFAGAIASFALTIFFVITTYFRLHGHGFGGWNAASFRWDAHAVVGFQESFFAEATDDTILGTDRARMGVGAGGRARGSTSKENFVFFAVGKFWWISEHLHGFVGIAFGLGHANAAIISQMTFFAEASDDAVLGTNWARFRIRAGRSAS